MPISSRSKTPIIDPDFLAFEAELQLERSYGKAEAGRVLGGRSVSTIERMLRRKELRGFRLGGKVTILGRDLALALWRARYEPTPLAPAKPVRKPVPPVPNRGADATSRRRGRKRVNPTSKVEGITDRP